VYKRQETQPRYIQFSKGNRVLERLPIKNSGLDFEFDEAQQTIIVKQYQATKQKWERFNLDSDTLLPSIKTFSFSNNFGLASEGFGKIYEEHPPEISREAPINFLEAPKFERATSNNTFQFNFEIPTTTEGLSSYFLQDDVSYYLKIKGAKEGDIDLQLGETWIRDIPMNPKGIRLQLTKKGKELLVKRPIRVPSPLLKIPANSTQSAEVIALLGRYNFANLQAVEQPNIYNTISDAYRENTYLNTALSKYFAKGFGTQISEADNQTIQQAVTQSIAQQEWQKVIPNEQKLAPTTESS